MAYAVVYGFFVNFVQFSLILCQKIVIIYPYIHVLRIYNRLGGGK